MKRLMFVLIAALTCFTAGFSTTFDECYDLGQFFSKDSTNVHQKITHYEDLLKADPSDYYADLAIGILYTSLARLADSPEKGANKKALEYTDKFLKKEGDNSLGLIYNGLANGLVARDSINPITKMSGVSKSSAMCDKAVKLSEGKPLEWYIRFMRANYYVNLPDFFKKRKIANEDYLFIVDEFNKNPAIEGFMGTVYFYLGEMEKSAGNLDKAVEYWKKSDALNKKYSSSSYEAKMTEKRLDTFAD